MNAIESLKGKIRGDLVLPECDGYDLTRAVWNGMIDKRPAGIARCLDADDVSVAVQHGRESGLPVSIRGNGHNIAGSGVCDDGLVIDLSEMNAIRIDPEGRRASVEPGATLGDIDAATAPHGLALPVGINSTTGISGLTLGGGYGWLTRKHGMTIDNLLSAEVVTAAGEKVRASAEENEDLFWALRGGGGNFGVVTRFEFKLHPVGPEVLAGVLAFPAEEARQVYSNFRAYSPEMPEELAVWPVLRHAPPLPFLKEEDHGRLVLLLPFCYCGDAGDGARFVAPLRDGGSVIGEGVGVQPFAGWQQAFDPLLTEGARNYWKSHNFRELSDDAIETILEFGRTLPTMECEIFLAQCDGAASRVAPDATAYAHRDSNFLLNVHGRWRDAADDERVVAWAREFYRKMAPFASGSVYSNFMAADEGDRVAAAYGMNYARLAGIKAKYDPANLFRNNTNIVPKAGS